MSACSVSKYLDVRVESKEVGRALVVTPGVVLAVLVVVAVVVGPMVLAVGVVSALLIKLWKKELKLAGDVSAAREDVMGSTIGERVRG